MNVLKLYLNEISAYPLLSEDEERELFKEYKLGNMEAKDKIINSNLRLVVSIAKGFRNKSVELLDLIGFGNEGLIRAVEGFDTPAVTSVGDAEKAAAAGAASGSDRVKALETAIRTNGNVTEGMSDAEVKSLKRAGVIECETCSSRLYQDGSNENDVSFKAPGHIDPASSAGTVMAHEQEHVANAYEKASESGGKVLSATVTLHQSICPECGRSYVSGGLTRTAISHGTEDSKSNPYIDSLKNFNLANGGAGSRFNSAV